MGRKLNIILLVIAIIILFSNRIINKINIHVGKSFETVTKKIISEHNNNDFAILKTQDFEDEKIVIYEKYVDPKTLGFGVFNAKQIMNIWVAKELKHFYINNMSGTRHYINYSKMESVGHKNLYILKGELKNDNVSTLKALIHKNDSNKDEEIDLEIIQSSSSRRYVFEILDEEINSYEIKMYDKENNEIKN